ncbi:MAG: DUF1223 domain-containing protein [Acidobacteriota bacterium]
MLRPLHLLLVSAGLCAAQTAVPVVVELFTSEGCSSCPSADQLLARFDSSNAGNSRLQSRSKSGMSNIEVIVLGEHVDYWDQLGWKDRFSSPLFSARQQDYGIALRAGTVYTPQAVVNGQKEVVGSDVRALSSAIVDAAASPRAPVSLEFHGSDTISLKVGRLPPGSGHADVLLAIAENGLESIVGGGENNGRRLRHVAVVRSISRLAELDGSHPGEYSAQARVNFRADWVKSSLRLIVLVQDRDTRRILGAASLRP